MERSQTRMLLLAFVLLSQAEARSVRGHDLHNAIEVNTTKVEKSVTKPAAPVKPVKKAETPAKAVQAKKSPAAQEKPKKAASLASSKISPPIKDVAGDKEFFGPPFPADYPDDKRPVVDKGILNKLKGPDQPYPALQSKADYDRDYVKDENSDRGAWKAQFEYDTLRNKLRKEAADARGAGNRAGKEGQDVDDAQRNADKAGKDVEDARRGVDEANAEDEAAKNYNPDDWAGKPSDEKLKKLKNAVEEAEQNLAKEQKEFEACKKQLEESKKILDDLKAREAEMEKELAAETKLWMESKSTRLNAKKQKESAAHSTVVTAQERLTRAQAAKAEVDKVLAEKKGKHEAALKVVAKEKADVEQAKKDLEKATLTLQKIRGYTPPSKPAHSSASIVSAILSFALLAAQAF